MIYKKRNLNKQKKCWQLWLTDGQNMQAHQWINDGSSRLHTQFLRTQITPNLKVKSGGMSHKNNLKSRDLIVKPTINIYS